MQLRKHKKLIVSIVILLCVIALILAYFFNHSINTIVNIIIMSFILAYTLSPIRDAFETKIKVSRRVASILVISIIVGIVTTCIIVIVPALFNEIANISNIFDNVNSFLEEAALKYNLNNILAINVIYNEILEKGNTIWINFSESAVDNLIKFSDNIISFAIIPIMIYYFLCDGNKIYNKSLLLLPTEKRAITKKILKDIDRVLTRYITSQLLLSGVIGVINFCFALNIKSQISSVDFYFKCNIKHNTLFWTNIWCSTSSYSCTFRFAYKSTLGDYWNVCDSTNRRRYFSS